MKEVDLIWMGNSVKYVYFGVESAQAAHRVVVEFDSSVYRGKTIHVREAREGTIYQPRPIAELETEVPDGVQRRVRFVATAAELLPQRGEGREAVDG